MLKMLLKAMSIESIESSVESIENFHFKKLVHSNSKEERQTRVRFESDLSIKDSKDSKEEAKEEKLSQGETALARDGVSECLEQAKLLMDHEEYELASQLLNFVLKQEFGNAQALSLMSVCFRAMNQHYKMLFLIKKIIKASKLNFENGLFYSDLLLEHQWRSEAKSIYFSLLKLEKEGNLPLKRGGEDVLLTLYQRLGDLYLEEFNFKEARDFYLKAGGDSSLPDSLLVRFGALECKEKNFEKALFYFREALEKNAENDLAWFGLSLLHRFYGDSELAWANLERALDINILNERALRTSFLWSEMDVLDKDRLIRILDRAKSSKEDKEVKMKVGLLLARVFYDLGQYKRSLLEVNEVVRMGKKCKGVSTLKVLLKEALKEKQLFKH